MAASAITQDDDFTSEKQDSLAQEHDSKTFARLRYPMAAYEALRLYLVEDISAVACKI